MAYALRLLDFMHLKYFKQAKVVNLPFYNFQLISQDAQILTFAIQIMLHQIMGVKFWLQILFQTIYTLKISKLKLLELINAILL